MDAAGTERIGINARGKRYFSEGMHRERPELRRFLFGDTMAQICRATLGESAHLFWEQYVIKAADVDTSFAWHQDSGYVHEDHDPFLSCWIALTMSARKRLGVPTAVLTHGHPLIREAHPRS